jgi:L-fucose mutarotase
MLLNIPSILSPELLKILMEMGHGDEIVLSDGNFPAETLGRRVVHAHGHGVSPLLDAILQLMPLDTYVEHSVALMTAKEGDPSVPDIWEEFHYIISTYEPEAGIETIGRQTFYERAKDAYAVVATGESAIYANIILRKGVVFKDD